VAAQFPERLQKLRISKGMNQRDLARAVGISHTQISRYEAGEANPRPPVLIRLANELGTSVDYLRDGLDDDGQRASVEALVGEGPLTEAVPITLENRHFEYIVSKSGKLGISTDAFVRMILDLGLIAEMDRMLELDPSDENARSLRKQLLESANNAQRYLAELKEKKGKGRRR